MILVAVRIAPFAIATIELLFLLLSATVTVTLQIIQQRHLHICGQIAPSSVWVVIVIVVVFDFVILWVRQSSFDHSIKAS